MKPLPNQKPSGYPQPHRRVIEVFSSADPAFVDAELERVLSHAFAKVSVSK